VERPKTRQCAGSAGAGVIVTRRQLSFLTFPNFSLVAPTVTNISIYAEFHKWVKGKTAGPKRQLYLINEGEEGPIQYYINLRPIERCEFTFLGSFNNSVKGV
jgi:hypothetical protein